MENKQKAYAKLANTLIEKCKKRGFETYYFNNSDEALAFIKKTLPLKCKVACGGSVTLNQTRILDYLREGDFTFYDKTKFTPEEKEIIYAKEVISDYYFMSTNAITFDGELINIDGNGNRVACLITGPKNVIIVAGMNKVVPTREDAISRAKNKAAPPNAIRLNRNTPCTDLGKCADCLNDDCICCHTVITRKSRVKNRIKLILIGEELGY